MEMDEQVLSCGEDVINQETDVDPPVLESQTQDSGSDESNNFEADKSQKDATIAAPVLTVVKSPDVDPENALRSPPKLLPIVVGTKRKSDESRTPVKVLTGSMKNTPASLSIIEAPTLSVGKSTRSTRSSIDPSFAAKQRSFLNKVHNALSTHYYNDIDDTSSCGSDHEIPADNTSSKSPEYVPGLEEVPKKLLNGIKRRREDSLVKSKIVTGAGTDHAAANDSSSDVGNEPSPKKWAHPTLLDGKSRDQFCWYCHRENTELFCASCPRGFHNRCLRRPLSASSEEEWVCFECVTILKAENQETRSKALKMLTLDQLCKLLLYAVNRMKSCAGADIFENPVDLEQFPSYKDHIVNPMHLSLLEKNIKKRMYGSTEAFIGDSTWILHNCIIFNSFNSKLTSIAKNIMKLCKQEMADIENCPDCYYYAYMEDENWFIKVCQKPHLLVWAKLKGFPYWPAKVIRSNSDSIDVRFFGAHDRAWVPARDCYLYCRENPNVNTPGKVTLSNVQQKKRSSRNNLDTCIEEVELHIKLLQKRFTTFQYANHRTPVNIKKLDEHLSFMLPDLHTADAKNSNVPVLTTKNPFTKHRSLELESAACGPAVKKMKADSSSADSHLNVKHSLDVNNQKENSDMKGSPTLRATLKENFDLVTKVNASSPSAANSSSESTAVVCKETSKSNGTALQQSKSLYNFKSVSLQTPSPCQSKTSITPLSSSEATSVAELRLKKKKDARKIVDRLQEKLNTMLKSQSENDSEELQRNGTEEDLGNVERGSTVNDVLSANIPEPDNDLPSPKRSALMKAAEKNILDSFKMIENQPKVVLTKLDLDYNNKPIEASGASSKPNEPSGTSSIKEECISSEDEADSAMLSIKSRTPDKVKVSEVHPIPDTITSECMENPTEKSVVDSGFKPQPRSAKEQSTSTSALPQSIKSNVQSGELHIELGETRPKQLAGVAKTSRKIEMKKTAKIKAVSVSLVPAANGNVTESPEELDRALKKTSESTMKSIINKELVRPNLMAINSKNSIKTVKVPFIVPKKIEPVTIPTKIISKSFPMCAKIPTELPEPKEREEDRPVSTECVELSTNEDTSPSSSIHQTRNNCDVSFKALVSNNVTVYLEPSMLQNSNEVKLDLENPSSSPESDGTLTKSTNICIAKTTEAVNQLRNNKSPSKLAPPAAVSTPLRQQTKSSPTSLLKPKILPSFEKGTSEALDTKESTINVSASQILSTLSKSNSESPNSSNLSTSVSRTPTFVTVSSGTGRRLLPKAVPIVLRTPIQKTSTSSSPSPESPVAITSRISVSPLVTSVSSTTFPPLVSGPQAMESVLKKTPTFCMVPKLTAAPTSMRDLRREMPPLSIGSISNVQSVPTTTTTSANVGCRPMSQNSLSGAPISAFESLTNLCAGEKPVSSELRSKAQNMTQVFLGCMKDFLSGMGSSGSLEAQVRSLQHDIELMQWRHQQELSELRYNTDLAIAEIRSRMNIESQKAVHLAVVNATKEKEAAVAAAKEKQWCAFCKKEAMFYCCWNTSYCDYQCQQMHWRVHSLNCTQNSLSSAEHPQPSSSDNSQTQPASTGRIIIKQKGVLSPPHLKKRGTPTRSGD